jgi:DnaJ-class molecular chaperone
LRGQGGPGSAGGQSGDLFLKINIYPHPVFTRSGNRLETDLDVDLYTMLLGGEVKVPTLNNPVTLTIPEATQTGMKFRLRGLGMPKLNNPKEHGDLFVRVKARLPEKLSANERKLFEELRSLQNKK